MPYELIYKERVRQGDLRADYDVILIPSQGRDGQGAWSTTSSARPGRSPTRKDPQFPTLGIYGEIGRHHAAAWASQGVLELQKFVEDGGVARHARRVERTCPPEFGLQPRGDAPAGRPAQFYAPGPIVQAEILQADASDLLRLLADRRVPVRYANGPLLQVPEDDRDRAGADAVPGRRRRRC